MLPYVVFFFFLQHPPFSTSASGGPPIISIVSLFPLPCLVFHRATFDVDAPIVKSESLLAFFARVSDSLSSRSLSFVHDASTPYIYTWGTSQPDILSRTSSSSKTRKVFYRVVSRFDKRRRAFLILSLFLFLSLSLSLCARARHTRQLGFARSIYALFLFLSLWRQKGREVP